MRKLYIILIITVLSVSVKAQHLPLFSQFELNKNIINPAAVSDDIFSINLFYRNQWSGFQTAPKTMGVNALFKNNEMTFGLFLINDKAGIFRQNTIHLNYAYDLQIAEKLKLSFGISGGVDLYAVNYQDLELRNENDPFILTGKTATLLPDFNFGLMLHSASSEDKKVYSSTEIQQSFYVGISVQHVLGVITVNDVAKNGSYLLKHYNLMGGYTFPVNNDFGIQSDVLLKYVSDVPFQARIAVNAVYKKNYWAGIGYRSSNDLILKLGMILSHKILIAYSFDLVNSQIPNRTSHEIILGFRNNNEVVVPKY